MKDLFTDAHPERWASSPFSPLPVSTPRRPWVPDGRVEMRLVAEDTIPAGHNYTQLAYRYHRTEPGGDGRVATIMTKEAEYGRGAHSSCKWDVTPDDEFDRFQWTPAQLWEIVTDVLGRGSKP